MKLPLELRSHSKISKVWPLRKDYTPRSLARDFECPFCSIRDQSEWLTHSILEIIVGTSIQSFSLLLLDISFVHIFSLFLRLLVSYTHSSKGQFFCERSITGLTPWLFALISMKPVCYEQETMEYELKSTDP